jgi:hypothetical protein
MSILEKFTVIDLIKTRSASVATIAGNILKFNNQTASELHYAPYIQVLINPKDKQFAIRSCKEDAPNAIPFSKPEGEQKLRIQIRLTPVTDMIRKMANWAPEENWNVPGVYFAEDNALVYDIAAAYKPNPKGGGWAVKRQKDAEAAALAEASAADNAKEGNE